MSPSHERAEPGATVSRDTLRLAGLLVVAIACFILGFRGFSVVDPQRAWTDNLYLTLQLFTFGAGNIRSPNAGFDVARFVAPLVTGYAAVLAAWRLLHRQLAPWRLRFWRGHTVVIGEGAAARAFVDHLQRVGTKVVTLGASGEPREARGALWDHRLVRLSGRLASGEWLGIARIARASSVVALDDDDATNIAASVQALEHVKPVVAGDGVPLRIRVHVADRPLRELVGQHTLFRDTDGLVDAGVFSVFEAAARVAWARHPLEVCSDGSLARHTHLVVIGFGRIAEAVVAQALRIAQFASGESLEVTVLDQRAESLETRFLQRHPAIGEISDIRFRSGVCEELTEDAWQEILGPDRKDSMTTIAVCLANETRGIHVALRLLPEIAGRAARILVRMVSRDGLARLVDGSHERLRGQPVFPFATLSEVCDREVIVGERLDRLARQVHAAYVEEGKTRVDVTGDDPNLLSWEALPEDLRASNRHQADHLPVKLRALGWDIVDEGGDAPSHLQLTRAEIELLARMEHARWKAERFLAGWRRGPMKDLARRQSPYLVSFDELPPAIQDFNRQTVLGIPGLLATGGWGLKRRPGLDR